MNTEKAIKELNSRIELANRMYVGLVPEYIPVKAKACWYCNGIQDHKIVSVKTVVDEFGRELPAYDVPYNYCPNCGQAIDWSEE